ELTLLAACDVNSQPLERVAIRKGGRLEPDDRRRLSAGDTSGRLRRAPHGVPRKVLHVCVPRGVPPLHTDAEPEARAAGGAAGDPFFEEETAARAVLEEEIRVIAAACERDLEQLPADLRVDAARPAGRERG